MANIGLSDSHWINPNDALISLGALLCNDHSKNLFVDICHVYKIDYSRLLMG